MPQSITVQAPAKLNLALCVGMRRADGMHPICSWMVTIDLFDELVLRRLENGRLSRYGILWHGEAKRRSEINWSITKDLAVRAHLELEKEVGRALPVQMKLEKRIPVGGGLGGGSSDAAAMLRGANELFELGLSLEELGAIGTRLGSDVPFLVHGGSAMVEGVGERVTRQATLPVIHAVVAFPKASCPTAQVYGLFDESGGGELQSEKVSALVRAGTVAADAPFNDLAEAAIRAAPRLGEDLRALSELAERPAHVSGSGSSIFVICDDEIHAGGLAAAVEKQLGLPAVSVKAVGP